MLVSETLQSKTIVVGTLVSVSAGRERAGHGVVVFVDHGGAVACLESLANLEQRRCGRVDDGEEENALKCDDVVDIASRELVRVEVGGYYSARYDEGGDDAVNESALLG